MVTKGDHLPPDLALIHSAAVIVATSHLHKGSYQHLGKTSDFALLLLIGCVVQPVSNPVVFNHVLLCQFRLLELFRYELSCQHWPSFFFSLVPLLD